MTHHVCHICFSSYSAGGGGAGSATKSKQDGDGKDDEEKTKMRGDSRTLLPPFLPILHRAQYSEIVMFHVDCVMM